MKLHLMEGDGRTSGHSKQRGATPGGAKAFGWQTGVPPSPIPGQFGNRKDPHVYLESVKHKYMERDKTFRREHSQFVEEINMRPKARRYFDLCYCVPKLLNYSGVLRVAYDDFLKVLEQKDYPKLKQIIMNEEFIYDHPYILKSMRAMTPFLEMEDFKTVEEMVANQYYFQPAYLLSQLLLAIRGDVDKSLVHKLITQCFKQNIISPQFEKEYKKQMLFVPLYIIACAHLDDSEALKMLQNLPTGKEILEKYQIGSTPKEIMECGEMYNQELNTALELREEEFAKFMTPKAYELSKIQAIEKAIIDTAIENSCLSFLKYVKEMKYGIRMNTTINLSSYAVQDNELAIGYILMRYFSLGEKKEETEEILSWKSSLNEEGIVPICARKGKPKMAEQVVQQVRNKFVLEDEDLMIPIVLNLFELALEVAKEKRTLTCLNTSKVQQHLVQQCSNGQYLYYCAELLNLIDIDDWDDNHTPIFCDAIIKYASGLDTMYKCHSPFLACVLIAEFCKKISNVQYAGICQQAEEAMIKVAHIIQENIAKDKDLHFIMQQKDFRGRRVLEIIAVQEFYKLLENEEVGNIVESLWNGSNSMNVFGASALHKFVTAPFQVGEGLSFDDRMSLETKHIHYIFQYESWISSCNARYTAEAFFTFLLAIMYQYVMNIAIEESCFSSMYSHERTRIWAAYTNLFIVLTFIHELFKLLFMKITGRNHKVSHGHIYSSIMFGLLFIFFLDIHRKIIPSAKEDDEDNFYNHVAVVFIPCLLDFVIWVKVLEEFASSKELGHIQQAIFIIGKSITNFIVVFLAWLFCCGAIFLALFHHYNPDMTSYSQTWTMLFSASLGVFANNFTGYQHFGDIMLGLVVLLTLVMFLNLMIALLTNVYGEISARIDATHRSILVNFHHIFEWNKTYGYLIFLPPPFNIITILVAPFMLLIRSEKACGNYCKITFLIFVVFPMFLIFLVYSIFLIPFCWIKGFLVIRLPPRFRDRSGVKRILIVLCIFVIWLFLGVLCILWIIVTDCILYIKIALTSLSPKTEREHITMEKEKKHIFTKYSEEMSNIVHSVVEDRPTLDKVFIVFQTMVRTESAYSDYMAEMKHYDKKYSPPLETALMYECRLRKMFSKVNKILRKNERLKSGKLKENRRKLEIIQNFAEPVEEEEVSVRINTDYLRCFFPKKYKQNPITFKRAEHTKYTDMKKAVESLREPEALKKQGVLIENLLDILTLNRKKMTDLVKALVLRDYAGVSIRDQLGSPFKQSQQVI